MPQKYKNSWIFAEEHHPFIGFSTIEGLGVLIKATAVAFLSKNIVPNVAIQRYFIIN